MTRPPAETIRRAGGGTICTPGEPAALADAMQTDLHDPKLADLHGEQGRAFVIRSFDREAISERFVRKMFELTEH